VSCFKTDYFCISDVDLIYHPLHIEKIVKFNKYNFEHLEEKLPIRVIFNNYNLDKEYYTSDWNALFMFPALMKEGGHAVGNGVIHRKSFLAIKGFEEQFVGYGSEDSHFNIRIEKINRIIYENSLHTYHLWHPRTFPIINKRNEKLWNDKKYIIEQKNTSWMDIRANFDKVDWGEY
jgi:hypothetical protein